MKQILLFLFLLPLIVGCKDYNKTIPDEQEMLRKELHTINWSEVDVYPSYKSCDTIEDVQKNLACFFYIFNDDINQLLQNEAYFQSSKFRSVDTLPIQVTVYPNAAIELKMHTVNDELLNKNKASIDSLLFIQSAKLKAVEPAIKRDVPVKTQFLVKVKINPNN